MMKKNILFVSLYMGIAGLFLYQTVGHDNAKDYPIDIIGYTPEKSVGKVKSPQKELVEGANSSPQGSINNSKEDVVPNIKNGERSIANILPNVEELNKNEIIDEAELLLASRNGQKISDGLFILDSLASENDPRANYLLGQLYEKGIRVKEDASKAFEHYKTAALNGSDDANIFMFNYYLDSELTTKEHYESALKWFDEASKIKRNPIAYYGLAYMYEIGLGVEADQVKAIEYYKESSQNNFILAHERLADLYLSTNDAKSIEAALFLFQRAANADIPSAQFKLGYMYEEGLGTRQDYETARFWYQKAANHDLSMAFVALGNLYAKGNGVAIDNEKAYDYYRTAAEQSNVIAQSAVARAFERGIGVDKSLDRAFFWYTKAAEQNDTIAQYNLGRILEEYEEIRNLTEAKKWYEIAEKAGFAEAKVALERLAKQ